MITMPDLKTSLLDLLFEIEGKGHQTHPRRRLWYFPQNRSCAAEWNLYAIAGMAGTAFHE